MGLALDKCCGPSSAQGFGPKDNFVNMNYTGKAN